MTGPTREEVLEWARSIEGVRVFDMGGSIFGKPEYLERFAALAFAAGQSVQASGSGAELVREVEAAAASGPRWLPARLVYRWDRLRAALLSGDAAREDAERLEVELAWQRFCWKNVRMLAARHRKEEWAQHMLRFCDEAGVKASPLRDAAIDRARGGK